MSKIKLLISSAVLIVIIGTGLLLPDLDQESLIATFSDQQGLMAVTFILGFALAALLFLPGSLFSLAGGALFGPWFGTLFNLLGATLGAAVAFLIGRYLAANWVENQLKGKGKALMTGVNAEGWRFVAFVRLVPLFPFNLMNYALGLTRIPFKHYIITSFITMAPGSLAFSYLGHAGRNLVDGGDSVLQPLLIALTLLGITLVLPKIIKSMKQQKLAI